MALGQRWLKLVLPLLAFLTPFVLVEAYYRNFGDLRVYLAESLKRPFETQLRSPLQASREVWNYQIKDDSGQVLRNLKVEFDEFGRRKTANVPGAHEFALLFGCSFTYGKGVSEDETLAYFFGQKSKRQVYVYAGPGHSPTNMLFQSENIDFNSQIDPELSGHAYYFLYDFQWRRLKSSYTWIAKQSGVNPIYSTESTTGELKLMGSFADAHPALAFIYSWTRHLHFTHYLFNYKAYKNDSEHSDLLCRIFNQSFLNLKSQLGDRLKGLYIVAPRFSESQEFNNLLVRGLDCFAPGIHLLQPDSQKKIQDILIHPVFEYHPRKEYNQWLANELISELDGD